MIQYFIYLLALGTMSSALRVRYTLDDSLKAIETRYPGCPPLAEGEHPSLHCHRRAAASRHTQLLSGFPAGCVSPQQRNERGPGTTIPINQQELQSSEAGALHELWCDSCGEARQRVVVCVCCNTIWQGRVQEKAVSSRGSFSCSVVLFVSSQETVFPFLSHALLV